MARAVKRGRARPAPSRKVPAKRKLVTIAGVVRDVAKRLQAAKLTFAHGTTDPVAEAAFIVCEVLGLRPDEFDQRRRTRIMPAHVERIGDVVGQRIRTRKPAAYLLHKAYMRGVPFYVDERAIVPRSYIGEVLDDYFADSDTTLIAADHVRRVLDLCTGSGCLAILAAFAFPEAMIDAVELSADALAVAERNRAEHGLGDRVRLHHGDLFAPLGGSTYDLIIANPPYVDAEGMAGLPRECLHEPSMALDGGADGIAIVRCIVDQAPLHLNPRGGLLCEVGRCRPALEAAYPRMNFLWLDTEESEGEVFWLGAGDLL